MENVVVDNEATPYDEVLYATHAYRATHPDRLATIARLSGLEPAPVSRCRFLELGCGSAENLIAIASGLPDATFVGCDLAAKAIASGRRFAEAVGLANVTLLQDDLRAIPEALGEFDYIVAHGVYSWIPAEVRDGMLALIARRLAPDGVAFVSYNAYPGCYVRRMAWEILKFHIEDVPDAATRLAEARALITLIADPGTREQPRNAAMRAEFRALAERTDAALFHDDLSSTNDPFYFHEFVAHAMDHGLQFLGEAEFPVMSDLDVAPAVRAVLSGMDRLSREQYLDFVRCRRFRQTLLCHADRAPDRDVVASRVAPLWAMARKAVTDEGLVFPSTRAQPADDPNTTVAPDPGVIEASRVLDEIRGAWPRPVAVAELASSYRARSNASNGDGEIPMRLAETLVAAYASELIELHTHVPDTPEKAGERPVASALVRAQLARGQRITNVWHQDVALDDAIAQQLIPLLDGTRDRKALLAALAPSLQGNANVSAPELLERYLDHCVELGLLVA